MGVESTLTATAMPSTTDQYAPSQAILVVLGAVNVGLFWLGTN